MENIACSVKLCSNRTCCKYQRIYREDGIIIHKNVQQLYRTLNGLKPLCLCSMEVFVIPFNAISNIFKRYTVCINSKSNFTLR